MPIIRPLFNIITLLINDLNNNQMDKIFLYIVITFSGFLLGSCSDRNEKEMKIKPSIEEHENTKDNDHGDDNLVSLSSLQIKTIGITMGRIEEKQLTASLKANGILRVPNQNRAQINSVYSGVVKTLLVQPGNTVKKGQVIATIANPQFISIQEDLLSLGSKIAFAKQELLRQQELVQGNAGALKNLQTAESNLNMLVTRQSSLQEQLRLMGIDPNSVSDQRLISVLSVRSPISGVVSNVMVKIGSFVNSNMQIAEVVDNSQLHLDLFVYEKDLAKLRDDQIIHFTLTNNPGKEYDAQIFSLGSSFEDETKAVSVHALVKGDKQGLIDGMSITALISLEDITAPAVPSESIVNTKGQDFIFIEKKNNNDHTDESENNDHQHDSHAEDSGHQDNIVFEKIPVATGTADIGYTQITLLKDIPSDSKVVIKGAFFVLAKMINADASHSH